MNNFKITSPETPDYNCIAWAAEEDNRWWEPDPMGDYYWPEGISRQYNLGVYIQAYEVLGYKQCDDTRLESAFKKIAIYIDAKGCPTHAARQLSNGVWTSKLGQCFDVEHDFIIEWPDAVVGIYPLSLSRYGRVGAILKKAV